MYQKNQLGQAPVLTLVIPAIWEAEIRRIKVPEICIQISP
jgi:hypothetical protein